MTETSRTWTQGSKYPMPDIPEPRGCWATVVIDPESFEPREATAIEIEEIDDIGVAVERLFIRPSQPSLSEQYEAVSVDAERERMLDLLIDARQQLGPTKGNVTDGVRHRIDDLLRDHGRLSGEEGA